MLSEPEASMATRASRRLAASSPCERASSSSRSAAMCFCSLMSRAKTLIPDEVG